MLKQTLSAATALSAILLMTSCSETPSTTANKVEEPKKEVPAEPIAGQSAFYQMYKPARTWATDLMPLTLAASDIEGIKSANGKFPMWTAVFVSPSLHQARTFFYSITDHGTDIHKGVSIGGSEPWSGATALSRPFQNVEFNVNSDAAYKAAADKAADWLKKNPEKKVSTMVLMSAARFATPVWYIMWGDKRTATIFSSARQRVYRW